MIRRRALSLPLKKRVGSELDEYFLLCPLETSKQYDAESSKTLDLESYTLKAVWQETPEIAVYSKDQTVPVDMDKLREIIPEARLYAPQIQNNSKGYVFPDSAKLNPPSTVQNSGNMVK